MLLLHLSDIHFREPACLNPDMDPERAYRALLLQHVRQQAESLGPVDAILIGGDIAFKGHPSEYLAALDWLRDLAPACGCSLERIFVVPGNHDVNRNVSEKNPSVRNAQRAVAQADPARREGELRTQFQDPDTSHDLLLPLAAYNDFAARFNCQVYSPDRLYWKQDLELGNGVTLRINGLTTVILSGIDGADDNRSDLYVSPMQTVLEPADDIVHIVMMHHPPDWLMDNDDVDDALNNRAKIHLLGHKHRQRIQRNRDYIRFSAGAVNPDRNEAGWNPGYNLIEIGVSGQGALRRLDIRSHLFQYQAQPERFRPITSDDGDVFVDSIPIPGRDQPKKAKTPSPLKSPQVPEDQDTEAAMSDERTRNLVYRFWNLTMSQRREIALTLGLLEDAELTLPEPERYGRALLRASERNLIDALADQVASKEKR